MKKLGFIFFFIALTGGIIAAQVFSFGSNIIPSPFSFVFGEKVVGSGNVDSESRAVSEFEGIKVSGAIKVYYKQSDRTSVKVVADDNILPLVRSGVKKNTLYLRTSGRMKLSNPIKVYVESPRLRNLRASGATYVEASDVAIESLNIKTSGASKIVLNGSSDSLRVKMSGASRVDSSNLAVKKGSVKSSGASSLKGQFTEVLKVKASGASSVKYKGSAELKKRISGGSSVSKL